MNNLEQRIARLEKQVLDLATLKTFKIKEYDIEYNAVNEKQLNPNAAPTFAGLRVRGLFRLDGGNVPTLATDKGKVGTITRDSNFVYVCIAPNTWVRAQLLPW